jgi:hypothetical protein
VVEKGGNKVSYILDNNELAEETDNLKDKIQSIIEELESLKSATECIVGAGDFQGKIADSFKAFFQEVHFMAIDILSMCLNDAREALEELKNEAINVDASEDAHIDTDYLNDINQTKLLRFKDELLSCAAQIDEQVSICNTLNLSTYISAVSTDSIESTVKESSMFLDDTVEEVYTLSSLDFTAALESDLTRLNQILNYMSNIMTGGGVSAYITGNVCEQSWYTDTFDAVEEYKSQLLKALHNKLDNEYKQGLIDKATWENLTGVLMEYGPTISVSMLTKALMKKVAEGLPELIRKGTTLFMNRGMVAALAGGGNYLLTESPTFLTSVARGAVKYGTPILYGTFEFFRLKADGQDTVEAGVKAVGHTASVMAGMALGAKAGAVIGTAIPIPIVGTLAGVVIGGAVGAAGSFVVDWVYDNKDKIAQTIGNFANDVKNKTCEVASNVKDGIGNAVSGLFGGVANVFS